MKIYRSNKNQLLYYFVKTRYDSTQVVGYRHSTKIRPRKKFYTDDDIEKKFTLVTETHYRETESDVKYLTKDGKWLNSNGV